MRYIKDDIWKKMVGMFYVKVLVSEINFFFMLFDKEIFELMRSIDFILVNGVFMDRENLVVVFVLLILK